MATAQPSSIETFPSKPPAKPIAEAKLPDDAPATMKSRRCMAVFLIVTVLLVASVCTALYFTVWKCDKKPSLHAVPDSEVPSTLQLQPSDTSLFDEIMTETHGANVVHGVPEEQPIIEAVDFVPAKTAVVLPVSANKTSANMTVVVSPSGHAVPVKSNMTKNGVGHWASLTSKLKVGSLIIGAKGVWGPYQSYLDNAAILLIKQCACTSYIGVILNQKCYKTMSAAFTAQQKMDYSAFVNNSIHIGGPVTPSWITLHTGPPLPGVELLPGVIAVQALDDAQAQVDAGKSTARDTMFFAGYMSWTAAGLQAEVDAGKWTVVEASATRLLALAREASWGEYSEQVLKAATPAAP